MNENRAVLADSPLLRQLFAIQDNKRMQNKDLGRRAKLYGNKISNLRRGAHHARVTDVEAIAEALGYEIVLLLKGVPKR